MTPSVLRNSPCTKQTKMALCLPQGVCVSEGSSAADLLTCVFVLIDSSVLRVLRLTGSGNNGES